MNARLAVAAAILLAAALAATPAAADAPGPVYLLFANTSSLPFKVGAITVGGRSCGACGARAIAAGTSVMVKIGLLGNAHLKFTVTGAGSCNYDIAANGRSRTGDCGHAPQLREAFDVHDELMFDAQGTPSFELIYAYDPPPGK